MPQTTGVGHAQHRPAASIRLRPHAAQRRLRPSYSHSETTELTTNKRGILGIEGLYEPLDCLQHAVSTLQQMRQTAAAATGADRLLSVLNDLQLRKMSVLPAFELLSQRHADAAWRRAAAGAAQLLEEQSIR